MTSQIVKRVGNSGLSSHGGKIQNNPTAILLNVRVLLFFVVF
jgi:hypothetical protein